MLLAASCLVVCALFGQERALFSEVQHAKEHHVNFETAVLPATSPEAEILKDFINPDEVFFFGDLSLNLNNSRVRAMNLQLSDMTLELVEAPKYFYDYVVTTSSGERFSANRDIKHYRGIVRNDPNSIAAITFYEDEIMGLIATSEGNFNIVKEKQSGKHIFYNDKNLKEEKHLTCGTIHDGFAHYEPEMLLKQRSEAGQHKKVRFYVETEYDIFQSRGSVAAVEKYITAVFNQVAILYQNENIATAISEIYVWTTEDPFTGSNTSSLIEQFQYERTSINGDLGILLTFRNLGGGQAAGFSGLCNPSTSESLSVAMIYGTYATFPVYSWTIMVVTHELGHLFGSRHTHACVWNGDETAIDGCAGYVEGYCSLPGIPPEGGTMMSYCHGASVGINFSLGFGPQPGNVIRNRVENAACLTFLTLELLEIRLPEGTTAIEPGETSDILIYLKNVSDDIATNLTAELTTDSPYLTINQSTAYYGQLYPEQYKYKIYNITLSPDTPAGTTELPLFLTVFDDIGRVMEFDDILLFENSGAPPQACNPIGNLSAEATGSDIVLSWDAPTGNAPKQYLVYYNDLFLTATAETTCIHENVRLDIYHYCVEAVYEDGCTSETECVEIVTPCNIDIKLTLRSYLGGIILTWLPRVENVTYKVYRNEEFMEEVADNTFKDFIDFDEKYCYAVVAVCPAELESEPSNEACTTVVGIEDLPSTSEGRDVLVYPNPATGELIIESGELKIENIDVCDMLGRKVMTVTESQIANRTSQITLDLSNVPAGVYFLQIKTEQGTVMRKVVKR